MFPRKPSDELPVRHNPLSSRHVPFPSADLLGTPAHVEANGANPVFVGSAIFENSVHPCKIVFSIHPPCHVPYGGSEVRHYGRYELFPITPKVEWVPTKNGKIPPNRSPVNGGHESSGEVLYYALGKINDVDVPGKTGEHLVSGSLVFTSVRLTFPRDLLKSR